MKSVRAAFILRQITRPGRQVIVFVLCVLLSIVTIVAIGGFSDAVHRTVMKDAKSLHAADIIVRSSYPLSESVKAEAARLETEGRIRSAAVHEFYSMVRTGDGAASLLSSVKVVAPGYPFYGEMVLSSGKGFEAVLTPGRVVVEETLLSRLGLSVGDALRVGEARLLVADVVEKEPDRPVEVFSIGPRVFVHDADLSRLDLVKPGGRVRYKLFVEVPEEGALSVVHDRLKGAASMDERVDTYRSAESRIRRFFDNFLFFLSLMGILNLLLAGIGIQSTLSAVLEEKETTVGVMKALGATQRYVTATFLTLVLILGLFGTALGVLAGYGLQVLIPVYLKGILPDAATAVLTVPALVESLFLGLGVVALFCLLPLNRLGNTKPVVVFRRQGVSERIPLRTWGAGAAIAAFVVWVAARRMSSLSSGIYFVLGLAGLVAVSWLLAHGVLWWLRKRRFKTLSLEQARKGLFRPGNRTGPVVVTLSAALAALFTMHLVERHLERIFVDAYPPDAPNLFFIDIQPDQVDGVRKILGDGSLFYPLVRAWLAANNDAPIDTAEEAERRGDNLARAFNLTYRDTLLGDERILKGPGLFDETVAGVQVSILDTVADIRPMAIGDRLKFNIQGLPLEAVVTSVRTREKETFKPFFYFVFKEEVLKHAPHTLFTAVTVPEAEKAALLNRMAADFPNVSGIDLTASVQRFYRIVRQLTSVVRFFGFFSILAGLFILIGSVLATRLARTREGVYFRILGADRGFVRRVFALENMAVGLVSGLLALLMARIGAWVLLTRVMDLRYRWEPGADFLFVLGTVFLVMAVGWVASGGVLRKKPVVFLRETSFE